MGNTVNASNTELTFGVNPFDRCPDTQERYHVVNAAGYILAKYRLGISAYDDAGNRSERESGRFTVIDTRDGSEYGYYENGEGF